MRPSFPSVTAYIRTFPKEVQASLEKIRQLIQKNAPGAVETISYGIPTFDLDKTHLVHFAAFKKHIGFFPTSSPIVAFENELAGYKTSKGTIQFPLSQPIPYALIKKITVFRVKEVKSLLQKKRNRID